MDETRRSVPIAVGATFTIFVIRLALQRYLHDDAPFLLFTLAVVASAIWGGFRAGLLATFLSALLATYFFLAPHLSLKMAQPSNIIHLLLFLTVGIILSYQARLLRRAQKTVEGHEEFLSKIVATTAGGILVVDASRTITFANPAAAELFGLTTAHMIGRSVEESGWGASTPTGEAIPLEDLPSQRVMRGGEGLQGYRMAVRSAGDAMIQLAINAAPLRDSGGQITGAVLSLTRLPDSNI